MTAGDAPRPHRPALFADLTEMIDAAGGESPASRSELAASTAALLVNAGRASGPDEPHDEQTRFVHLADTIGLDTLAALWRDAEPVSLAGALWALYLLRQWCHGSGEEVVRLWRAGQAYAPADAVVGGVADYPGPQEVGAFADAALAGVYRGDLSVALERAAAFFRVVAAGRRALGEPDGAGPPVEELADRNERTAAALAAAAARWRAGTLT